MTRVFIVGALFGLGWWALVRGLFPPPVDLATRLARFTDGDRRPATAQRAIRSGWGRLAVWVLRALKGELIGEVEADVELTGRDLTGHAVDKLNAGTGGAILVPLVGYILGMLDSSLFVAMAAVVGAIVCYVVPDIDLARKAEARRDEFDDVLTGLVSLVAVSISGGGGVNTAMADATDIGDGWCFELIARSLEDSALVGESPWTGFDRLGRRLNLISLIELAGALSLAGTSGARVAETLQARAESSRTKDLADARTEAETKSETMSIPIATMLFGWFGFVAYPALVNLLGT